MIWGAWSHDLGSMVTWSGEHGHMVWGAWSHGLGSMVTWSGEHGHMVWGAWSHDLGSMVASIPPVCNHVYECIVLSWPPHSP